jgi:hypothetical protein
LQPKAVSPEVAQLQLTQSVSSSELAKMRVRGALPIWLETRRSFLAAKTFKEYTFIVRRLSESLLGEMCPPEIEADHIRQYQSLRLAVGCAR